VHGGTIPQNIFNPALEEKLVSSSHFALFRGKIPRCKE